MELNEIYDLINEFFKCSLKKSKNPIEDMFYEAGVYDEKAEVTNYLSRLQLLMSQP
jgi:cyclopropane fatty-acyl-phospholipid synthase-like methyltransferase